MSRWLLVALVVLVAAPVAVAVLRKDTRAPAPRGEGQARQPEEGGPVSLTWVGDISLSSGHGLPSDPERTLLGGVKRLLGTSDITLGNLEGTLGSGGASKCAGEHVNCFAFQAPPAYARLLKSAGFDVMNLANNHAFDFGASGQRQTIAALERQRLGHSGRPGEVLVRRARGLRIAIVGFAPYPWSASLLDTQSAQRLTRRASSKSDLVVAVIHAGAEGSDQTRTPSGTEVAFGENRGDTRGFAHAVVRAGADVVLGSGPHVVRGIEAYRGRLIAYSLGNFLGYHTFSTGGTLSESGILRVRLAASGRPIGGRWISVRLDGAGVPYLDSGGHSAQLVRGLSRQDFGPRAYPIGPAGELRPPR